MEDKLKEKLTNIIQEFNKKDIEQLLEDFYNKQELSLEFLQDYIFSEANQIKLDLFFKYEKYLINYVATVKILMDNLMINYEKMKEHMLYSILFNTHHSVELFYKTYKIFYFNLYGSCINSLNAFRPPFLDELSIGNHNVINLFDDKEVDFICDIFDMNIEDLKQIKANYLKILRITEFENLYEQARFPQERKKCVAFSINYNEIYTCVNVICSKIMKCLEMRYSKTEIDKSNGKKLIDKLKEIYNKKES
ncbi:MAG: hypothetical protein ACI4TT_02725 [Christensenellales bacterium]